MNGTKKLIAMMLLALGCVVATSHAEPIDVAGEVFDLGNHAFPTKVEIVGYEVTSSSIADSYTYLEGANLRGWRYGMTSNTQMKMVYQAPIQDQPGDDIYFGQGRMAEYASPTGDRHALEFSFDGVTWYYLGHADFTMASTYWYNTITHPTWYWQLYRSSIDLADYGITEPVTELFVRGVEYLNLILVGNLNAGIESDGYKPLVNLLPEAVSFVQHGKTNYNGWYRAKIFAHDAAGIKNNVLWQRFKGDTGWTPWSKVDTDNNLSSTIGGYYGGYYSMAYDYVEHAPGTLLKFKHVTIDNNKKRTVIIKKARVKANGSLKFLN